MTVRILVGDALAQLRTLPDESVQCCVTSPPYWGLRDYGVAGQLGLEKTPDEYAARMVEVFREVRRVLRKDGTLWLNIGDSYVAAPKGPGGDDKSTLTPSGARHQRVKTPTTKQASNRGSDVDEPHRRAFGLRPKNLVGIPWMLAFALRGDGWTLRQDIIWSKPNPMPESVRDRCTKSHEYVFLLAKSASYFYDADAIAEPFAGASLERLRQDIASRKGSDRVPGKTNGPMKAVGLNAGRSSYRPGSASNMNGGEHVAKSDAGLPVRESGRNKRSVWSITTKGFTEAHFATMPPELAETCILAGAPYGGVVLDPFAGAGTTGLVADRHGRDAILIELNPIYAEIARARVHNEAPLLADVEVA